VTGAQGTVGAQGTIGAGGLTTTDATTLNGISAVNLFNNMGQGHSTRTSFDASTSSYGFGFRFVQGTGNGPAAGGGGQFYSWYQGLGSEYPATGAGSYGMHMAIPRNASTPYMSVRYNEGNSLGSWLKIASGYADSSGSCSGNSATATTASSCSGNSATATTLSGDSSNWASLRTQAVANMLSWKHYGNSHVIFDASNGTAPNGASINNTNANTVWTGTYPTLMGWNGSSTYGVRVDSARISDSTSGNAATATAMGLFTHNGGQDFLGRNKRCIVATTGDMYLNYGGDFTSVIVQSSLTATGNVTAYSDRSLKENIETIPNALSLVQRLRGVTFDWIADKKRSYGVIAQEVEEVVPEFVHETTESESEDKKTIKSVAYGNMVSLLIEAIKEQQSQIEELKLLVQSIAHK
jgi:putative lipoic acid-binding regulatory protein